MRNIEVLIEDLPLPVFLWQCRHDQVQLFQCNDAGAALNGAGHDQIIGESGGKLLAGPPDIYSSIQRCMEEKRIITTAATRTDKSGKKHKVTNTFVPYLDDLVIEYVENETVPTHGLLSLVTGQVPCSHKTIRQPELILQALPSGVYELDAQGIITYANPTLLNIFKRTLSETVGKSFFDLFTDETSRREVRRCMRQANKNSSQPTPLVLETHAADGENIVIHMEWRQKYNGGNEQEGFIGAISDITERHMAQKELLNAHAYLEAMVRTRTQALARANVDLKALSAELEESRTQLSRRELDLLAINRTISIMAQNMDKSKLSYDREIALTISTKLLPLVENLVQAHNLEKRRSDLYALKMALEELTQPLEQEDCLTTLFSITEMKIAILIKNGMTSAKIAKKLCVSEDTIKTHRRNIRRKLGLKNAKVNLRHYLEFKWDVIAEASMHPCSGRPVSLATASR